MTDFEDLPLLIKGATGAVPAEERQNYTKVKKTSPATLTAFKNYFTTDDKNYSAGASGAGVVSS